MTSTSREHQYTLLTISRSVVRRTRNDSNKTFRKNRNTHFMVSNFFPRKPSRLWDNVE